MFNSSSSYSTQLREINFMARVYGWMSFALVITALSAYWVANTPAVFTFIFHNPAVVIILMVAQIALVMAFTGLLHRLSFGAALGIFVLYSLGTGIVLSVVLLKYTMASVATTFAVTAGTFAAMAVYGYVTKSDLTSLGNIIFMALVGLIIATFVNMFLHNEKLDIVLSGIGVLIFTLLVAVDAQRIKYMGQEMLADREQINKIALLGSLTLYLDFINLFIYLLRFLGKNKNSE